MAKKQISFTMIVSLLVGVYSHSSVLAVPTFLVPTAYLSSADSPFDLSGLGTTFFLEDFEDNALNTPGVSGNGATKGPDATTDSVDADGGGAIDSSGLDGISYVGSAPPSPLASFDFSAIAEFGGSLPTHVGIVWTDGLPQDIITTFEAFDSIGVSLGTILASQFADATNTGETAEDRFFGVIDDGGISRITISNNNTQTFGIEVDHLQYGIEISPPNNAVPEPITAALGLMGLGVLGMATRRRVA